MNKLYEFCTSFSLEVNLANKTKKMIFGHNKRKLNQEPFKQYKDQIDITMNTNTLGLIFIHMVTLSHLVKGKEA
jgi:hypothetical protein